MPVRPALVAPLFVLSGAVALGSELAWFRWLAVVFGATHAAAGALLGAFMAGLALGSEIAARTSDRIARPLRAYALCEAVVAACALATPFVFAHVADAAAHASVAGRLALAFAVLAPPTVAMGATTPLLVAATVGSRESFQRGLATLYAVNLAGGTAGVLLAGFVLLPRIGLAHTLHVLAATAAFVACGALALDATRGNAHADRVLQPDTPTVPIDPLAPVLLFAVGAVSFTLQVAYNRVFALLLGSSAYTFALVSAVVLATLALGGARAGRIDARPWDAVTVRLVMLAVAVFIGTLVVHVVPAHLRSVVAHGRAIALTRTLLVVLVVAWPGYQIGGLFPLLAAFVPARGNGRTAGRALLASTSGNVAGALASAFVSIPSRGVQWTLDLAAAVSLALALLAARRASPARLRGTALASALALVIASALDRPWSAVALSAGSYRVSANRESRGDLHAECGPSRRFPTTDVLFARDGALGSVVVFGHRGDASCALYSLRVNGKAEGSVFVGEALGTHVGARSPLLPVGDLPSETLVGWLPARVGPEALRALVVGWGTGLSNRALLDGGARDVVGTEIEPVVLDAARLFDNALFVDPRVHVVVDDARMVLRRAAPASFDVVVSHPSNPWVVGATALFSREYFELVRSRLAPGGRALAWVQLYEIDRASVRSLVATFASVFPSVHAFRPAPGARDLFLLGSLDPSLATLDGVMASLHARTSTGDTEALARTGAPSLDAFRALHVADGARLREWSRGAELVTDDNASLEFRVAERMLGGTGDPPSGILAELERASP